MPLFVCAALVVALQDPQTDLNPATAFVRPAAAPKQEPEPVQEPQSQEPVTSGEGAATGLDALDEGLLDFERENQAGWNVDVSGFLKFAFLGSNARRVVANSDRLRGLSLTAARVWVDAEVEGWQLRFGLRGEQHSGLSYLGLVGDAANVRMFELVAKREFNENVNLQMGRIRVPFLQSALYDDNQLMFLERTFQGEDWDSFSNGATLNVRIGDLEGFLGVHNGVDNFGSSVALTGRGLWHITGDRGGMHINEGPFDAPEGLALTVGAAAYVDTETDNLSSQAVEAYASWRPVYLSGEVVDRGEGFGELYSWGVTAAVLLGDSFTIQGRFENFDRDDGTDVFRVGFTHYLVGHDIKWHLEYADAESNAPLANLGTLIVGAQFSF